MRIIPIPAEKQPLLDPDLAWNGAFGDLVLTAADDPDNPAGLRSVAAIETAVLICLMTDVRADPVELRDGDTNRGWPGDAFDLEPGEAPLGSKLWLLRRRALTPDVEMLAADYARAALQTLVDQGAFVRFDVVATADRAARRLELAVTGYGREGSRTYDQRFAVLWDQI